MNIYSVGRRLNRHSCYEKTIAGINARSNTARRPQYCRGSGADAEALISERIRGLDASRKIGTSSDSIQVSAVSQGLPVRRTNGEAPEVEPTKSQTRPSHH